MQLTIWDVFKSDAIEDAHLTEDQVAMEMFKFELDQFHLQLMHVISRQLDDVKGIDKGEIIRLIFVPILYMIELPTEQEVSDGVIRYARIFDRTKMNPADSIFEEIRASIKPEAIRIKLLIKSWVDNDKTRSEILLTICNVLYLLHDCLKLKKLEKN